MIPVPLPALVSGSVLLLYLNDPIDYICSAEVGISGERSAPIVCWYNIGWHLRREVDSHCMLA